MSDRERILRLLAYKNILQRFKSLGFIRVFSDNIAEALDISASLVRKDFGLFGISGSQKGGYHIDHILEKINGIIGFEEVQNIIIVGVGRIGEALMQYNGFRSGDVHIVAGFDIDTRKINKEAEIPVFPMEDLPEYVRVHDLRIAVMSVPEPVALHTFDLLRSAGIRGILNFTPVKIKSSPTLAVTHINIEHELRNLLYFVKQKELITT